MNDQLENKLKELNDAKRFECWYIVKQNTDFPTLCYFVSFLVDYKNLGSSSPSLQDYITYRSSSAPIQISTNYRALRVALNFGLLKMTSSSYTDAQVSDTYLEIKERCNGRFEEVELYQDIITRQIEKFFVASDIDEEKMRIRETFSLYPIMFLNKVLLEMGESTGEYEISMDEFRYIVATSKKYEYFLDAVILIRLLRIESDTDEDLLRKFRDYRDKFDNRINRAIASIDYFDVSDDSISIKTDRINEVRDKVCFFEKSNYPMGGSEYIEFLCSTESLFTKTNYETNEDEVMNNSYIEVKYSTNYNHTMGFKRNRIIFGAPGTGKSYKLNEQKDQLLNGISDSNCIRVTFHPEYSYANFVGTYKPVPYKTADGKNGVTYSFIPGPFLTLYTRALKNAQTDEPEPFLLIVEEINRANVAAVFGDIFQLLDRTDKNVSEYPICPTEDIRKYLAEELNRLPDDFLQIRLPDNFYIWATMNSADQGVFPLDTAFKRRWDFTYVGINESDDKIQEKVVNVKNNGKDDPIHWNCLRKAINDYLAELGINEDKQLGPYFIGKDVVGADSDDCQIDDNKFSDAFKNKVIMYLFEDAARQKRKVVFSGCGEKAALRYSEICRKFDEKGIEIFDEEIRKKEDAYEAEFKAVNE